MSNNEIIVTGYPRSGNTWLSRLLGDALNSPITGWGNATPIAQEGQDRTGDYIIRQLHLVPTYDPCTAPIMDTRHFAVNCYDNQHLIIATRDPRDVCVSCYHYWKIDTIRDTILAMYNAEWPLSQTSPYHLFIEQWANCPLGVIFVGYENMLKDTELTLNALLSEMNIKPVNNLQDVINRQSLEVRRKQFEQMTTWPTYNTGIQLANLRKGIAGDWCNHFSQSDKQLFDERFHYVLEFLEYECDREWVNDNP